MINDQLINYIKKQLSLNVSREKITSDLKSQGWTEMDVSEAFTAIGSLTSAIPSPVSPVASPMTPNIVPVQTMQAEFSNIPHSKGKKIFAIIFVLILLGLAGGYVFYQKTKITTSPVVVSDTDKTAANEEVNQTSTQASITSNPDIERVKVILEDIRQGLLTGNQDLVIKHSSIETASFFSLGGKLIPVSEFSVNEVTQSGPNILANISSSEPTINGPMVFIKEAGDWKLDMTATFKYAADQNNAKKGTGDQNGLPDLVVTGVTAYPSHPVVNSKDVRITVTIKNVGTKTSDGGTPLVATILGFEKETPVQGGQLMAITPGEVVTWDFHPYDKNDFFKVSDTPGEKTIQIVLNKYRDIVESSYDNNIFTQKVEMFSK